MGEVEKVKKQINDRLDQIGAADEAEAIANDLPERECWWCGAKFRAAHRCEEARLGHEKRHTRLGMLKQCGASEAVCMAYLDTWGKRPKEQEAAYLEAVDKLPASDRRRMCVVDGEIAWEVWDILSGRWNLEA